MLNIEVFEVQVPNQQAVFEGGSQELEGDELETPEVKENTEGRKSKLVCSE